jgi:hypothetical protein
MDKEIYDLEHPVGIKTNTQGSSQKAQLQLAGNFSAEQSASDYSNKTKKICPICKNVYSAKYNYCPSDGANLFIKLIKLR